MPNPNRVLNYALDRSRSTGLDYGIWKDRDGRWGARRCAGLVKRNIRPFLVARAGRLLSPEVAEQEEPR